MGEVGATAESMKLAELRSATLGKVGEPHTSSLRADDEGRLN